MRTTLIAALSALPLLSVAQDLPQPSPKGSVEQVVGLTEIEVEYSRPSMKGRKIFGELVPFGEVWRTGANQCTIIELDGPVKVEGQDLAEGKYSLFTIPSADTWVIIFNKNTELWGEGDRKDEEDVLRVKVKPAKLTEAVENFTIGFDAVKDDKAVLTLRWENTAVNVGIEADATEKAMANIKEALAKKDADFRAYHGSARFLVDRNKNLTDALAWAEKSTSMEKKYWNMHTLALAQAANGQYKAAMATAEESMKLAQEAKNEAYVKMNKEKMEAWKGK